MSGEALPPRFPKVAAAVSEGAIGDRARESPASIEALRDEALYGRLLPGDGALPLAETLEEVPGVPLSFELRSKFLMTTHPNPVDRARTVLAAGRELLRKSEGG
jgi:hypothetical protein